MRGDDRQPDDMFSHASAEQRVPQNHPLRAIRALWRRPTLGADEAYDTFNFVDLMGELNTSPHLTQNLARSGGSGLTAAPLVMRAMR